MVELGISQRLACRIIGISRSTVRRGKRLRHQPDKYAPLRSWMHEFVLTHSRWGYQRAWRQALQAGFEVGRDAFLRIWREEGLRVRPRKQHKQKLPASKQTIPRATAPHQVWSLDFQFDSTWHGKTIKMCNVIDEFTRQHVAFRGIRRLLSMTW